MTQFRLPRLHRLTLGLLLLGLMPLAACDQLQQLTTTSPDVTAPASPSLAVSPASPAAPTSPAASPAAPAASPIAPAASPAASPAGGNIGAVVTSNPEFSTLTSAVQAAGLTETLAQPGNFTVFAPTNAAFNALPANVLQALLKPENKPVLTQILAYHVVPQEVTAAQITSIDLPTLEGQPIKVRPTGNAVKINEATVTQTDLQASNGVIHAIDQVLLPPGFSPAQLK